MDKNHGEAPWLWTGHIWSMTLETCYIDCNTITQLLNRGVGHTFFMSAHSAVVDTNYT